MPALNPQSGLLQVQQPPSIQIPLTASGRAWNGSGQFIGFRLNAQTTVGSGIRVYDGWDNTGDLIHPESAPAVGGFYGPAEPHAVRFGIFVEFLGTGQDVTVQVGVE